VKVICGFTNACYFLGDELRRMGHREVIETTNQKEFFGAVQDLSKDSVPAVIIADDEILAIHYSDEEVNRMHDHLLAAAPNEPSEAQMKEFRRRADDITAVCDGTVALLRLQHAVRMLRLFAGPAKVQIVVLLMEHAEDDNPLLEKKHGETGADVLLYGLCGDWQKRLRELFPE